MSETNSTTAPQDELSTLKAQADALGITYHPSIGVEKLREKLAAAAPTDGGDKGTLHIWGQPQTPTPLPTPVPEPEVETPGQRRKRLKMEAMALVRIRLTCMNPSKKEWDGEIITTGNSLVGTVSKYIPFNADEGWHIPKIMLEVLRNRQCQIFVTTKSKNGVAIRQGKLIKEFAIEVLPQLTADELHELAQRQAMAQTVE